MPTRHIKVMEQGIDIFQIETRNPHLHEDKGDEHLQGMLLSAMSTIYHSPLCDGVAKQAILAELVNHGILKEGEEPAPVRIKTAPKGIDIDRFISAIRQDFDKYHVLR